MSVTWMDDYQRDPTKAVRRQLEALWKLDADRIALGRLQKAFGAVEVDAKTVTKPLSVIEEQPK